MKTAYIINGSEDGLIAVATNPEKAVLIAAAYVEQAGGQAQWCGTTDLTLAISRLRKKEEMFLTITNLPVDSVACSFQASADITKQDTNWYRGRDW